MHTLLVYTSQVNSFSSCTYGQEWIQNVRVCLETNLVNSSVYLHNGTCDQLLQFGFSTHPRCYLVNGFCTVILKSFTNLVCLTKVFDVKDFFSKLALKQVNK